MRRDGRFEARLQHEWAEQLWPLLRSAPADYAGFAAEPLQGGRGGTVTVRVAGERFVVRAGRRGGLPGRLVTSMYWGRHPRVFEELDATLTLRNSGAPIVDACAAGVEWLAPWVYRSWLVTRWVANSSTLWEWLQQPHPDAERRAVLHRVGVAVHALHQAGARHPDLNLNNILVQHDAEEMRVWLLDLDGVRRAWRVVEGRGDLARLRRSARKLDPSAAILSDADLQMIDEGYADHPSQR